MNPLTFEWIRKAEGDWATLGRELRARKNPNFDAACFHAQQCAEKYLKALLQEWCIPFGKTHNLAALLGQVLERDTSWEDLRAHLDPLTVYAVVFRYPGESATKMEGREALKHCRRVREEARSSLGLS
jgi:HEPN domain-containing protein